MNVEACTKCGLPVIPSASDTMKQMGTVCTCASTIHRYPSRNAAQTPQEPSRNKYGAQKTQIGKLTFDSLKEARRYEYLHLLELAGEIEGLECQPSFSFDINGIHIGSYKADFCYKTPDGELTVEDCKSAATRKIRDYPLRKRLLLALYGIELKEV